MVIFFERDIFAKTMSLEKRYEKGESRGIAREIDANKEENDEEVRPGKGEDGERKRRRSL